MTRWKDGTPATLEVVTMRLHQGRPVVAFKGYASINDAESLAGLELRAEDDDTEPLPEGEYYHRDLIGCTVVTEDGETIGRVTAVQGERAVSRLVVTSPRSEIMIPLAEEICTVDLEARRITVRPPKGLLELNGEWR